MFNLSVAHLRIGVWLSVHLLCHQVALSVRLSLRALAVVLVLLSSLNLALAHRMLACYNLVLHLVLHLSIPLGHRLRSLLELDCITFSDGSATQPDDSIDTLLA